MGYQAELKRSYTVLDQRDAGDPENFLISDCDTQRNLNDDGKKYAIKIGVALANAKN